MVGVKTVLDIRARLLIHWKDALRYLSRQKMVSKWIDVLEKGKPCKMIPINFKGGVRDDSKLLYRTA